MSKRLSGSVLSAVLCSLVAVGSAQAQAAGDAAPASGNQQSAPNTTVVQPAPAPAPTVVQQPAQAPVAVEKQPEARQTVVQQTNVDAGDSEGPSVFSRAALGLLGGTMVGGAGGYLVGRQDGWKRSDWQAVGLGLGIGALAGTGVGLMFGLMDKGGVRAGRYIPRDMFYGAGLGLVVGAISGGIAAAATDDMEKIAFGGAVGILSGAGVGIITGIIEGAVDRKHDVRARTTASRRVKLSPSFAWTRPAPDRTAVVMPGLAGRF